MHSDNGCLQRENNTVTTKLPHQNSDSNREEKREKHIAPGKSRTECLEYYSSQDRYHTSCISGGRPQKHAQRASFDLDVERLVKCISDMEKEDINLNWKERWVRVSQLYFKQKKVCNGKARCLYDFYTKQMYKLSHSKTREADGNQVDDSVKITDTSIDSAPEIHSCPESHSFSYNLEDDDSGDDVDSLRKNCKVSSANLVAELGK